MYLGEGVWQRLPSVEAPSRTKNALMVPDAWSVASAVWARPTPSPKPKPTPPTTTTVAPAPVQEPSYLTVVVEPWARVSIDGINIGQTPLGRIELDPGTHRITLVNDHVVGVIRDDVVLEAGNSVTKRYRFSDTGYLSLVVTPWADVSVDGRPIGQTPLGRVAVPAGSHVVRFSHPDLGATERDVDVVSGQTTLVKVELR